MGWPAVSIGGSNAAVVHELAATYVPWRRVIRPTCFGEAVRRPVRYGRGLCLA
jgi:hypothetical protein